MKIEVMGILYQKNGEIHVEPDGDSDLVLHMIMSSRRRHKKIFYNPRTKKTFSAGYGYGYRQELEEIQFDQGSLDIFDEALALFVSGEDTKIDKNHKISIHTSRR